MKRTTIVLLVLVALAVVFHFKNNEEKARQHYLVLAFVSLSKQSGYAEMETRMNLQKYDHCVVEKSHRHYLQRRCQFA